MSDDIMIVGSVQIDTREDMPIQKPVITIITQPQDTNIMEGSISGSLTVAAMVAPGGMHTYQWYSNTTATNSGGG